MLIPTSGVRKFFQDRVIHNSEARDIAWYGTDGKELDQDAWENTGWMRTLGMMLNGATLGIKDAMGNYVKDCSFLLLLNAHDGEVTFILPPPPDGSKWFEIVDTNQVDPFVEGAARENFSLDGRSLVLLIEKEGPPAPPENLSAPDTSSGDEAPPKPAKAPQETPCTLSLKIMKARSIYSARKACMGSIFVARLAGSHAAMIVITEMATIAMETTTGSSGLNS